jgi:hypothetical protein
MIRRLFTAASVLSLLLCIAMVVLWVRSYWFADAFGRSTLDAGSLRYTCPMIVVKSGRIIVSRTRQDLDRESFALWAADLRDAPSSIKPGFWHQFGLPAAPYIPSTQWDRFGVAVTRSRVVNQPYMGYQWFSWRGELRRRPQYGGRYSETAIGIEFSCGYLVVLCLIAGLPAMKSFGRVIRERGRNPTSCRHCGYDLRASKDRCPECGTPIPSQSSEIA